MIFSDNKVKTLKKKLKLKNEKYKTIREYFKLLYFENLNCKEKVEILEK